MPILVALIPVILFLLLLVYLDSFKLIKTKFILLCVFWGALSAIAAYYANTTLMNITGIDVLAYSRMFGPVVEEILKVILILIMIKKNRIGFMVDGAIYGFAVGTGFALLENIYYLYNIDSGNIMLWIVRGVGTAIMHGGTTSIIAIIIMQGTEQLKSRFFPAVVGLVVAILLHMLYNRFLLQPLMMAMLMLVVVFVIELIVFRISERSLRKWLEIEFDSEVKLLTMIRKGQFAQTRSGEYIMNIRDRFSQIVVVDMLAYISLYLEISIKAKTKLMLHEAGFKVIKDPDIVMRLNELSILEKNIGTTGILAISPVLRTSKRDLWKWSLLK